MIAGGSLGRRAGRLVVSGPSVQRMIGLALLVGLVALRIVDPPPVERLRLALFDLYQRISPRTVAADSPVVIVDIDDESLKARGQWPWPRTDMAQIVVNLVNAGAAVVGFDMIFAEPDRLSPDRYAVTAYGLPDQMRATLSALTGNDELFAGTLSQAPVVLALSAAREPARVGAELPTRKATIVESNGDPRPYLRSDFAAVLGNIPVLEQEARGLGMISLTDERDTVVRNVPAVVQVGDTIYPTLALEMLRVASGQDNIFVERDANQGGIAQVRTRPFIIPTDVHGNVWIRFARHDPRLYIPAIQVLENDFDHARVRDRLVLVGASASALGDIRATPVSGRMPGVEIHAQLLQTVLMGQHLSRPHYAVGLELFATLMFGLAIIVLVPSIGARWTLPIYLLVAAALSYASWFAFAEHRLMIDATYPVLAVLPVFIALVYANYARVERQKAQVEAQRRQIRTAFVQYLSPTLVEELVNRPERLRLGGETKEMTMLFSDVHGFTELSEIYKYRPQDLTRMINELLSPLADAIMAHWGTIDKYMGDAIMAFWNAPLDAPDHPLRACRAALAMQQAMRDTNDRNWGAFEASRSAETGDRPFIELKVGIGVNTGIAVVGNMGSHQRFDYSVLGDAVNLASRLEGQTRTYGVDIIVGAETAAYVDDRLALLELDLIAVKGKSDPEHVYALLGDEAVRADPAFQALRSSHEAMIAAYRRQDWDEAERLIADCRRQDPYALATLYMTYALRLEGYRRNPPGPDWAGVHVSQSK